MPCVLWIAPEVNLYYIILYTSERCLWICLFPLCSESTPHDNGGAFSSWTQRGCSSVPPCPAGDRFGDLQKTGLNLFSIIDLFFMFYRMNINVAKLKCHCLWSVRIIETIFFKLQIFQKLGQNNSAYIIMSVFPLVFNLYYELYSTWEYILIYWILIKYSASFWIKHDQLFFFLK